MWTYGERPIGISFLGVSDVLNFDKTMIYVYVSTFCYYECDKSKTNGTLREASALPSALRVTLAFSSTKQLVGSRSSNT